MQLSENYYDCPVTEEDFIQIAIEVYGAAIRDNSREERIALGKWYRNTGEEYMILTKEKGININHFKNTSDKLPENWEKIEFNFRIKNHRIARDHPTTRVAVRLESWGGTKKYPKPILSYWTDSLERVQLIMKHGDVPQSVLFVLEDS